MDTIIKTAITYNQLHSPDYIDNLIKMYQCKHIFHYIEISSGIDNGYWKNASIKEVFDNLVFVNEVTGYKQSPAQIMFKLCYD